MLGLKVPYLYTLLQSIEAICHYRILRHLRARGEGGREGGRGLIGELIEASSIYAILLLNSFLFCMNSQCALFLCFVPTNNNTNKFGRSSYGMLNQAFYCESPSSLNITLKSITIFNFNNRTALTGQHKLWIRNSKACRMH